MKLIRIVDRLKFRFSTYLSANRVAVKSLISAWQREGNFLLDKRVHDQQRRQPHMHRELEYTGEANCNVGPKHPEMQICTCVKQSCAHLRGGL